ncbi:MAG: phosphoadenosine phosphosulfate reductase [Rhodopila sp.]|nr:phosphoadenosine phosphosulfate reductase [Rhodopila sp.]
MPRSPSRANTRALLAPFGTSGLAPAGPAPDVASYDHILIFLSGGKDSIACIDAVLAAGADPAQIELHHHDVDGAGAALMDWPVTASYCRALAASFGLPLFMSWKEGGFVREMVRDNLPTAPIHYQSPSGRHIVGGQGPRNTRLRFPQVSADLSVRWCSAYLKIMVADALIRGDDRFLGRRTLVVTGERAEESPSRARYAPFEPHRTDTRDTPPPPCRSLAAGSSMARGTRVGRRASPRHRASCGLPARLAPLVLHGLYFHERRPGGVNPLHGSACLHGPCRLRAGLRLHDQVRQVACCARRSRAALRAGPDEA